MLESASGRPEDPLERDPRVKAYFGNRYPSMAAYARLLATTGVERGLVGPKESGRLWERHLLNCAAVVPLLGPGSVADVGSGAGLPGLVVAIMEPERDVTLVESMSRRAVWLTETASELGLARITVVRARAEEIRDGTRANTVVARAVAPLSRLLAMCGGLVADGGEMLFLKGRAAREEVVAARGLLEKKRLTAEVIEAGTIEGVQGTTIVRLRAAAVG